MHDMDTLKQLIEMGFSPMMALVVIAVMVLWTALGAVVVFMWRSVLRERKERDQIRDAWMADVEGRLKVAEAKNEACDKDRDHLHDQLKDVRTRLSRFELCTSTSCPMRLTI